jgi:hypothetical protein
VQASVSGLAPQHVDLFQIVDHMVNLVLPGLSTGMIAAAFAKLVWRRGMAEVPYLRLALWAGSVSAAVAIAGLVTFGRDGRMHTYVLMVCACAVTLVWVGRGARAST